MKSKRIFIMLTVMMIVLSVVASSYDRFDELKYVPNTSVNTDEKFIANSGAAAAAHQKMLNAWRERDVRTHEDSETYTVDGITAEGYPEYYAGSYINAEGNLVVLLTEEYNGGFLWENAKTRRAKDEIRELTERNDIIFGTAKYSYRDFIKTMDTIYNFMLDQKEKNYEAEYRITGGGPRTNENRVKVYIYPLDDGTEKWFKENVIDVPWIVFSEMPPDAIEATASVVPGTSVCLGNSRFSVGFRAYKGSVQGFVTCAHPFQYQTGNVNVSNYNNAVIGSSYANERKFSGKLDAAFVRVNAGHTVTNTVYDADSNNSYTMSPGYMNFADNQQVYMVGEASSAAGNIVGGFVIASADVAEYNGVFLSDLCVVSYYANPGDSGGIVFSYENGVYKPCGIQVARSTVGQWSYVCKAGNIVSEFGLTIQ